MSIFDRLLRRQQSSRTFRRPRASVRVSIEERAEMQRVRDGSAQFVILENLSQGGARIATPSKLSKGEELTLVIDAGKHEAFRIGCCVVTSRRKSGRLHFEYGVKFVAVRPGEIERLRQFVSDRDDSRKAGNAAFI